MASWVQLETTGGWNEVSAGSGYLDPESKNSQNLSESPRLLLAR